MNGHRIDLERLVQAPAERVWEVLTDVAHADQTLSGVEYVELISEGPYRVGTRWRETRRMFGKEATEQLQVTVAEVPTRWRPHPAQVARPAAALVFLLLFALGPDFQPRHLVKVG
jgi:hypothetical protein